MEILLLLVSLPAFSFAASLYQEGSGDFSVLSNSTAHDDKPALTYLRGDWGPVEHCNQGHKARGFALKVDPPQGRRDDTGLNAIALECTDGAIITSTIGHTGTWTGYQYCEDGELISSYQLMVEPPQCGADDAGATNLNAACTDGQRLYGRGLDRGVWSAWRSACRKGICGLRTKVEPYRGKRKDDTALNDVQMICCSA